MTKAQTKFDVKQLREKVLSSEDIQYGEVYVEAWDVTLPIKTLSTKEMKEVTRYNDDSIRMMILAVLYGCKTREGEAVFEKTDLAKFETEKSFAPIAKVAQEVMKLSGLSDDAVLDAKND